MNLTIGNGKLKTWQALRTQYVATACGLALAATALVGLGTWRDAGPAAIAAQQPESSVVAARHIQPARQLVFVIAGSELQANDHRAAVMEGFNPDSGLSFSHFVVTTEHEEAQIMDLAAGISSDLSVFGSSVSIVDLRSSPAVTPPGASSAAAVSNVAGRGVTGPQVSFYLVGSQAGAGQAQAYEELAQWVRHDNGVPEPNRSVITLIAGSPEEQARAQALIDDAMAAANFSDSNPAPSFSVIDLR